MPHAVHAHLRVLNVIKPLHASVTGQCGHNIPDRMAFSVAHRRRAEQIAGMTVDEALALPDYKKEFFNIYVEFIYLPDKFV